MRSRAVGREAQERASKQPARPWRVSPGARKGSTHSIAGPGNLANRLETA